MLEHEEYVEQAYLYRAFIERLPKNMPLQELFRQLREELLASTRLPLAIDFLRSELEHSGVFGLAMAQLPHYFTPFQAYVVSEAERESGRFDLGSALRILQGEAEYQAKGATPAGLFLFQFESLCRNRLRYDAGLSAISQDPLYDDNWRSWILTVRKQVGLIDFADLVYLRSEYYQQRRAARTGSVEPEKPVLFGEREGKVAYSNRGKDPLYLFAAMQRHLGYPTVPRPQPVDSTPNLVPQLARRIDRLEARLKLFEEEQKGGIDIAKFYEANQRPPAADLRSEDGRP